MAGCDNDYTIEFTIIGKGRTKKRAEADFDKKLQDKLKDLEKEMQCGTKECSATSGAEEHPTCDFDFDEINERECKKKVSPSKGKSKNRKRWRCAQTFEAGCFCSNFDEEEDD